MWHEINKMRCMSIKKITPLVLAVLIAGCGGGSGGTTPGATGNGDLTISGAAVKGPLSKAKISFYKTTADGKQGDLLKETLSDDNGKYTVTVSDFTGVVLVVASTVTGQTTMYDEATDQTISLPVDFRLRASFPVETGKTYSAQINPFTDLATATALVKSGGLSAFNVVQANNDLAASLTFNPLTTPAVFDANHKPTDKASAALMAVSQMALSGDLGCATGDQATKVACVTTALSTKGLADAGVRTSLQANITLVVNAAGLPAIALANPSAGATSGGGTTTGSTGSTTPSPGASTPVNDATPLEQAKTFMGVLRSNAKALDAADLSLQTELQNVATDLRVRTAPLVSGNIDALNMARLGAKLWNDGIRGTWPFAPSYTFLKGSSTFAWPSTSGTPAGLFSNNGFENLGSCSFYSDTNYSKLATSKADAKYLACAVAAQTINATDANGELKQCSTVGEWCNTVWSYRVRLHPDATNSNKFTIYTLTRETKNTAKTVVNLIPTSYNEARTNYGAAFPGNAATLITQQDSNGKTTALNLVGEVSPAFSITSNWISRYDSALARWVYKPNIVATVLGDKHNLALSAVLTTVGELDKLAISGSMELFKAGVLESRIELAEGSYLQGKADASGDYKAQDGSQEMLLKLKGGTIGSTLTGDLKFGAFKLDASGTNYIPTLVSFSGNVQRNGATFFEGGLTVEALNHARFNSMLPQSTSNVVSVRAGFVGKVSIPNRPLMSVSLSATQNDTGSSATNTTALGGQYVQGLITINVSGTGSAAANTVTLESTNGIKLVIDKSKASYPLMKDGQLVGEYSTSTNRITYTDNSYEQF